ncbi:O-methyltransferase-domain-containing protein [Aspergillus heterothallicus]
MDRRYTLKERASAIFETANSLADELSRLGQAEPSFEHGLPVAVDPNSGEPKARDLKQKLHAMVDELNALLTEPYFHLASDRRLPTLSLHPIIRLGIAEHFPDEGTTVTDLAESLSLGPTVVKRLLKHSATYHIFYEGEADFFVHTAASRALSKDPGLRDMILMFHEECAPVWSNIHDAALKYPTSEEPKHPGWNIGHAMPDPIPPVPTASPSRAARFARAMAYVASLSSSSTTFLTTAFPFPTTPTTAFTVVDVGGGHGHASRSLARHDPHTRFIVQDTASVIAQGFATLPEHLKHRIAYQAHDVFQKQPMHGADVYLLRHVLHNWPDTCAVRILRALVPALKPGAKIVVSERVLPRRHEVHYLEEREARHFDLHLLAVLNAMERSLDEWKELFRKADGRFEFTGVKRPNGAVASVIEVTWTG